MIEITYGKNSELKFTLDISGQPGPIDEIRLVLDKDGKKICYSGILQDGVVTVELNGLNEMFKPGMYDYSLEVIIGNQYFKPIVDKLTLKEEVKISSKVLESSSKSINDQIKVTKVETEKPIEVKNADEIAPVSKEKKSSRISSFLFSA